MVYSTGDRAMFVPKGGKGVFLQPKPIANWKHSKTEQRNKNRRKQILSFPQSQAMYEPPRLNELRRQNRLKTRKFFSKKRCAPQAPRNTTSFIIRAKKEGGIASLVSPMPATPAFLNTPAMSPAPRYREGLVDQVNKEWGVDGYGSMNGLIRLRPHCELLPDDSESDSDMEHDPQSVQHLEQRLDQDVSRFEMIYPCNAVPHPPASNISEIVMDDQENLIAHLEEENLTLKERIYVMEQELEELRRRLQLKESGGLSEDQAEVCSDQSVGDVSCAVNQ